jgi:hypothetical protein
MTNAATDAVTAPSASAPDQVLDTMISLTRITPAHRVIVAGSDSMEFYLALRRRGFIRVATPEISRVPRGQHAVGLMAGQSMLTGIEPVLVQISPFLAANAGLAVLVGSRENGLKIRNRLEQLGFRIEAGVRCRAGLVLSAYRQGYTQIEQAA